MMDDFIRPPKKEVKQETKQRPIKEVLIVILIIVCLAIGYFAGYVSKKNVIVKNTNDSSIINEVYDTLDKYWVNTNDQDVNLNTSAIEGMVAGLNDPHSSYLTSKEAVEFNQTVAGNYQGIGVGFSMVEQGAMITKVYSDSPASKAGLKVGDIITKADGNELAQASTDQVRDYVRGEDGTEVTLTILNNQKTSDVTVTRGALDTSAFYEIRKQGNVSFGYIELSTFGTDTAKQVEIALEMFKKKNIQTLVIDLRDNGGGYLTAATDILDLFFTSDEVIYQMKEKNSAAKKYYAAIRQDSENPVYYVQYAHARICTLLAAMAEAGCAVPAAADVDVALLTTPQEHELIKQIAMLPEEIHLAARDYDPSRINRYVTELAARFHRFYNVCRIKDAEPAVRDARLKLADTTRRVLEIGLDIIGVTAPEKM